ncbi:hypothetical protein GO497_11920 [Acidovorax citrulli]|nr:hypothetical protein [Paracidovorax citrulli]
MDPQIAAAIISPLIEGLIKNFSAIKNIIGKSSKADLQKYLKILLLKYFRLSMLSRYLEVNG